MYSLATNIPKNQAVSRKAREINMTEQHVVENLLQQKPLG